MRVCSIFGKHCFDFQILHSYVGISQRYPLRCVVGMYVSRKCGADSGRATADRTPSPRGAETVHVAPGEGSSIGSATGESRASAEMQLIWLAAENVPIHSKQGPRN